MKYLVYNNSTGEIIRTYRKISGESGEIIPAEESDILSDLPLGLTEEDVSILAMREYSFERGKNYRVDLQTRQLISEDSQRLE
jgi:hypothetical protein